MRILSLKIENFKGIRALEITPNGGNVVARGDNATGKTTIIDSWIWLLFEKDSTGASAFQWKPCDENGNEIHNLVTSVSAVVEHDGERIELHRTVSEKWTKPRGQQERVFKGHESSFFIDGLSVKRKEWQDAVYRVINEDTFKILTNPVYFNEQIHWQTRREMLLGMIDQIEDAEIDGFSEISEKAGKHTPEQFQLIISQKIKDQKKRIPDLESRIDEAEKAVQEVPKVDGDSKSLEAESEKIREEIAAARSGGVAHLREELAKLEQDYQKDVLAAEKAASDENKKRLDVYNVTVNKLRGDLRCARNECYKEELYVSRIEDENDRKKREKENLRAQIKDLKAEYIRVKTSEYEPDQTATCPKCGEVFDLDSSGEERFNQRKAEKLARIAEQGKSKKTQMDSIEIENVDKAQLQNIQKKVFEAEKQLAEIEKSAPKMPEKPEIPAEPPRMQELRDMISGHTEPDTTALDARLAEIAEQLDGIRNAQSIAKNNERQQIRVAELRKELKDLVREREENEQLLIACEKFAREKMQLIEDRISNLFDGCRYRLFEEQINGGYRETCECMINGVPYNAANNAARINAGISIINAFAQKAGVEVPVFIDNAESVVEIKETIGQRFALVVDGEQKELKIEIQED